MNTVTAETKLTDLYRLHEANTLGMDDRRWLVIQESIYRLTSTTITKSMRGLFGGPLNRVIEEVQGAVLGKFITRKYTIDGDTIEPVLRATILNEMRSVLRKSQSVTPVAMSKGYESEGGENGAADDDDLFDHVRQKLRQPFRFAEAPHVREAVLAFLLTSARFPPQSFIGSMGVPPALRRHVFNAAVFDINEAIHTNAS